LKISDEEFSKINMERTNFRGDWNYVISPQIESFIY
jgi:hypothetical protein